MPKYRFNTMQYSLNVFRTPPLCIIRSQLTLFTESKMENGGRPGGVVDQRPQIQVLHWQDLISATLDLLQR